MFIQKHSTMVRLYSYHRWVVKPLCICESRWSECYPVYYFGVHDPQLKLTACILNNESHWYVLQYSEGISLNIPSTTGAESLLFLVSSPLVSRRSRSGIRRWCYFRPVVANWPARRWLNLCRKTTANCPLCYRHAVGRKRQGAWAGHWRPGRAVHRLDHGSLWRLWWLDCGQADRALNLSPHVNWRSTPFRMTRGNGMPGWRR